MEEELQKSHKASQNNCKDAFKEGDTLEPVRGEVSHVLQPHLDPDFKWKNTYIITRKHGCGSATRWYR